MRLRKTALRTQKTRGIFYWLNRIVEDREDYAAGVAALAAGGPTHTLDEVIQSLERRWVRGRKKQRGRKKK